MLAQRLQAKPEPHEDPLLCCRLLQQEAAIFSQSPSTPPGCDVGYGEREFQRQLSAIVVCYCASSDHAYRNSMELFIPIVHAVRHNPAVSRNILTKWQPPIWLRYRKAGVHAAPAPPTVVAQAWFYIKSSIVVLLLINTTTLQLQCFLLL